MPQKSQSLKQSAQLTDAPEALDASEDVSVLPACFDSLVKPGQKYRLLLWVLLLLLTLHPLLEGNRYQVGFFNVLVSLMLASNILLLNRSKRRLFIGLALAIPELVLIWLNMADPSRVLDALQAVFFIPFHIYAISCIYRDLFRNNCITADEVRGALCVYILLGATWSAVFMLIERVWPGAFYASHPVHAVFTWSDMIYFSLSTLASLGYGDIVPIHPLSRSMAIIESTMGIFYVAVIVARLVSQYVMQSIQPEMPKKKLP